MATSTTSARQSTPRKASIALKITMAISGLWLVFYVLMHMYGNLKMFAGQAAFDEYAHHLRTMFEPILPYSGFLWLFRLSLLIAVVAHVWAALVLTGRAHAARTQKYVVKRNLGSTLASRTMRYGGVALLLFVIWHLLHFTIAKINVNPDWSDAQLRVNGHESPYLLAFSAFGTWWMTLIYLLALVFLGLHLRHGIYSSMQTLGATGTKKANRTANLVAIALALIVAVGFALPPLAILFGMIGK
ncbi:succinate dehydrogenase cytochrome b subunit [Arsenicicoccus sp. oral taxon 190]|uniref:succinate dehydrogenase cytochrome b subunit n=1 Tax=Arsenicicoccus sp. oral taxon 190 TaxID=1658671 RepID=UPI00067A2A32|nr:succinate dehydrogenase cytochrome b subunit [Arsenicicoccus sp. oral taxon 190]AKT50209.1 succinate dehydrogenase [Arsenicicoccus sp. oral taxon 190]